MPVRRISKTFIAKLLSFQQSESKFIWILIAVFSTIVLNPLLPSNGLGSYVFNVLMSFIVLSGILAASDERQIIRQLTFIGMIIVALDWARTLASRDLPGMALLIYAMYAVFVGVIAMAIIIGVVKSKQVTVNIICGAVAAYLLIGLCGGFIALFIETLHPGAFLSSGEILPRAGLPHALMYYSMVSLSTIGYGDITPSIPIARSVSLAIGLMGQIYLAVLVAMLVGKFLQEGTPD